MLWNSLGRWRSDVHRGFEELTGRANRQVAVALRERCCDMPLGFGEWRSAYWLSQIPDV